MMLIKVGYGEESGRDYDAKVGGGYGEESERLMLRWER